LLAVLIAAGCGSGNRHAVRPATTMRPLPAGHARVIFSRSVKIGWGEAYVVVNARGELLGETPAESYFDAVVPAGPVVFYGWNHKIAGDYGRATMLEGTLEEGRAYWVIVDLTKDGFELLAPNFEVMRLDGMTKVIAKTHVELVPGQPSKLDAGRVRDQMEEARERLAKQTPAERLMLRTLGLQSTTAMFCVRIQTLGLKMPEDGLCIRR
jgi:hypothetical protein